MEYHTSFFLVAIESVTKADSFFDRASHLQVSASSIDEYETHGPRLIMQFPAWSPGIERDNYTN